jgi:hypothetical protein
MKKTRLKRLALAKETLRTLESTDLRRIAAADSGGSDTGSALCGSSDERMTSCQMTCTVLCATSLTVTVLP